jgi:hypothetical protein
MIAYSPVDGDVLAKPVQCRPRTCFIMTQLGASAPKELVEIRAAISEGLKEPGFDEIDATSRVTGKDFLLKIWAIALSVPIGIGVITEDFSSQTFANIFYEIGLMQALGKETIVVKSPGSKVPSDFVRTEYIQYDTEFRNNFKKFLDNLSEVAGYYSTLAEQVRQNPLLSIDYYRRAYLITGANAHRESARNVYGGYLEQVLKSLNIDSLIDFSWLGS